MASFKLHLIDANGDDDVSEALQVHMIKAGGCLRQSRKRISKKIDSAITNEEGLTTVSC